MKEKDGFIGGVKHGYVISEEELPRHTMAPPKLKAEEVLPGPIAQAMAKGIPCVGSRIILDPSNCR